MTGINPLVAGLPLGVIGQRAFTGLAASIERHRFESCSGERLPAT
jgi:hypothetical protein